MDELLQLASNYISTDGGQEKQRPSFSRPYTGGDQDSSGLLDSAAIFIVIIKVGLEAYARLLLRSSCACIDILF